MLINNILDEINEITSKLIGVGLSIQQNFPAKNKLNITWQGEKDISTALRHISYLDKYSILNENRNFNIKLIDGALIQLQYRFSKNGRKLISHRLAFFPSPTLERYEEVPDEYEKKYFGDSEFHDLIDQFVITFPIRFDFNHSKEKFIAIDHPFTHLHLGDYETCRIPVSAPISPSEFINFILINFYNTAIKDYCDNLNFTIKQKFEKTIVKEEQNILHFTNA